MLLRVRTNAGIWRVDHLNSSSATINDVLNEIAKTRPHVVYERPLSFDARCDQPIDPLIPLSQQQLAHGAMIHCRVEVASCVTVGEPTAPFHDEAPVASANTDSHMGITKRIIDKDGSIKLVHAEPSVAASSDTRDRGFRKGLLPLRDMKMAWTLREFNAMDDKYNFKIQRQEKSFVGAGGVCLESAAIEDFQRYLRKGNFLQQRFGYLYGTFVHEEEDPSQERTSTETNERVSGWGARYHSTEDNPKPKKNAKVIVEAIYEPPQKVDPQAAEGYLVLEDSGEETVEELAKILGLTKVGWIVGHPPREAGFQLSAAEVINAAELQLECAQGIEPTPFVTIRVTVDEKGNVVVEAFQVSLQCMEMVAEEALVVGPNPGFCYVNETFTAIQEGKPSATVENNFFLTVVPIHRYQSERFVCMFPRANRQMDDRAQSKEEMKRQLSKSGTAGWTFVDLLSDFALLLYLCQFLDVSTDMPIICESVKDRDVQLDDGYKIIISSIAGMDESY